MRTSTKWILGLNIALVVLAVTNIIVCVINGANFPWVSLVLAVYSACSFIIYLWKYRKG